MSSADGARCRAIGVAICRNGLARIFASTRSNGRALSNCGAENPVAWMVLTRSPVPLSRAFSPGHLHRKRIDVACQQLDTQRLRRRYRQHAGAGAEIEHAARTIGLQHMIQQQQAAAGGAVVAGAERQRSLDLDADLVRWHLGAVMPAMHDEAAGTDRDQFFQRRLDPILGFDDVEGDVTWRSRPRRRC